MREEEEEGGEENSDRGGKRKEKRRDLVAEHRPWRRRSHSHRSLSPAGPAVVVIALVALVLVLDSLDHLGVVDRNFIPVLPVEVELEPGDVLGLDELIPQVLGRPLPALQEVQLQLEPEVVYLYARRVELHLSGLQVPHVAL